MTIKRRKPIIKEEELETVDAVLCSDLHIRADVPICRTDDYQKAMFGKLEFIFDLCRKHNVPLLCGGDIGHRPQWPNWLLERFMALAEGVPIVSALGQHDLPGHNLNELERSACGVLKRAGVVSFDSGTCFFKDLKVIHFDQPLPKQKVNESSILITHRMVIDIKEDYPDQKADDASLLLKQLPFCKLILTGDNHKPFVIRGNDNRLLVNPGSMMRMTAAQANHKPRVYLYDAQRGVVKPVYLPVVDGVVDRSHIDHEALSDERMKSFVDRIKMEYDDGVDFLDELRNYLNTNRTWGKTQQKIYEACEETGKC
jgi:hypothetical protein